MTVKPEYITHLSGKDFVLYSGLLNEAHEQGLKRIATVVVQAPTEENGRVAIVTAEVETEKGIFTGIGDADPNNVNRNIAPHILRMSETRAKARALRDAVNIGMTAFEELGGGDTLTEPKRDDFMEQAEERVRDVHTRAVSGKVAYEPPDEKWDPSGEKRKLFTNLMAMGDPGKVALTRACLSHKKNNELKPLSSTTYLTLDELKSAFAGAA